MYTCFDIYLFIIHCYGSGRSLQKGHGDKDTKARQFSCRIRGGSQTEGSISGSLQNLSSPFPGRSNDMEHLVCMVFCDDHSIYRTPRFIIKCGNRKSTATVMVGWKGYEFSPTNFNHYTSCTFLKMPKAPGSQTRHRAGRKKTWEIFKSIWMILSGESLSLKISLNISYPICFGRAGWTPKGLQNC